MSATSADEEQRFIEPESTREAGTVDSIVEKSLGRNAHSLQYLFRAFHQTQKIFFPT